MAFSMFRRSLVFTSFVFSAAPDLMAETVVTTYVTTVQEERQATRWTLTEWLKIKERMKMMDVWLAMFSDPKKDQFRLELNLIGGASRGKMSYVAMDRAEDDHGKSTGNFGRGQLWLTNLFTGTTGARLLNIDFGVEGGFRHNKYEATEEGVPYAYRRDVMNTMYSGNFRIFGKNIQDSSLVLKVGQYNSRNSVANLDGVNKPVTRLGLMLGGELQLYLFRWLGAEANYADFQKSKNASDGWLAEGSYYDYGGYIEVSLLRLMLGAYHEDWTYSKDGAAAKTADDGIYAGAKLQF